MWQLETTPPMPRESWEASDRPEDDGGDQSGGETRAPVPVCNLVFNIPLHAARRAMATAVAVLYITFSLAPDQPCRS